MTVEVWGCGEGFWLRMDGVDISIASEVLEQFLQDEARLRELLELQKKAHEKWLEETRAYIRALFEEEEKYGLDPDKYPPELVKKLREADYLDNDIAWAEEQIERINAVLKELEEGCS